jgi:DNA-binding winged helix-turn-helix (wHTH) protein
MQVTFGTFTVDTATRELRCGVEAIHVSPKAFDLLALLVRNRPNAISKADLHRELWPDTFVSDGSLAVLVTEIRRALGDAAHRPQVVRTVNRFGYAFVGERGHNAQHTPITHAAACWLTWGAERARLKPGDNVLGRDPDADVCIDAIGISRRHAVIAVDDSGATIADLSSKNGTFANGARVTAPIPLSDDAEICVGPIFIRFRRTSVAARTQTLRESQHPRGEHD